MPTLVAYRALGLGDLVAATPVLRALARAFPDHRRILAIPDWLFPLVDLIAPATWTCVDARPFAPLALAEPPDVAVNLHGKGPQSHRVLAALAPRRLIAFRHPSVPSSGDGPEWWPEEHEVARWCRLLAFAGIDADARDLELLVPDLDLPARAHGATLIHPGASTESRRWPVERWIEVARRERAAGHQVLVTGGLEDIDRAGAIAAGAGLADADILAGRTTLVELAALVAAAGRVACGDTGVAHLATAYGTPSVVLFGPVPPSAWGPPAERPQHRVLWAGRVGDPHGDRVDPGLLEITPEIVAAALDALAAAPPAARF